VPPCSAHSSHAAFATIIVSLEALVSGSKFSRHLAAKRDLSFFREWTRELYAARGRPSTDQVVFCNLQLVKFFERIQASHPAPGF